MDKREMVSVEEAQEMLSDDARAAVAAGCDVLWNTPAHAYGQAAEVSRAEDLLCDVERLARTVIALRAEHAAALAAARREGAEGMLARCRTAALDAFMAHPLTLDPRHEPGCICHAIARGSCSECDRGDAIMAALAALPLDAPGGGS